MKKVAIIHESIEWTEKQILSLIHQRKDVILEMFPATKDQLQKIISFQPNLVLNRVYASVSNRNYGAVNEALELIKLLEESKLSVINSYRSNLAEYSKYKAYLFMEEHGVLSAKTILYDKCKDLDSAVENLYGYPIIVKRDRGGRGLDVRKCNHKEEILQAISNIKKDSNYTGGILLQEFIEPVEPNDYRVWVINGRVTFCHKRSLQAIRTDEKPWLASISLGSKLLKLEDEIPHELERAAIKAAQAVRANFDVLDMVKSKDGYVVIEHNLTPQFTDEYEEIFKFNPVRYFFKELTGLQL